VLGLDAAPPAAFLALVAPRLRGREPVMIAILAAIVTLVCLPFVPAGVPLLIVAALVALTGLVHIPAMRGGRRARAADPPGGESH
jgi:predicted branched-subunit amino acid permease